MFVRIMTVTIIFLAFIIILCPGAHGQSVFKCGKEFRIETQDGATFQGKLISNNGNLLTLRSIKSGLQTIAIEDAESAFRVKRKTLAGFLIGSTFGTGVGLLVAIDVNNNWESQRLDIDNQIWTFVLITAGSGIVGGIVGGIIGNSTQKLSPVQIEALPMCLSPSGDIIPVKVNFAFNF